MPEPASGSGRYMPGLDGLRALAVAAVVVYHLGFGIAPGGLLGVGVFFVLSGYLITDLLLGQWEQASRLHLRDFWLRRARRLLPALFLMLLVTVTWMTLFDRVAVAAIRDDVLAAALYFSNWWYIFHHVSYFARYGPPSPLTHLWSLAIEEQFYLVWPLLLTLGLRAVPRRSWLAVMTLALVTASALDMSLLYHAGGDPNRVYYGTDTRSFALLIGATLAFVWPSRRLPDLRGARLLALDTIGGLGLLVFVGMAVGTSQYETFLYRGGLVLLSLAAAAAVATLAHPSSRLGRLLGSRPMRWLGVRSYGIYLWHYPVIVLTTPAVNTGRFDLSRALLQIGASVVLAALSWRFVEQPIRRGALSRLWQELRKRGWRLTRLPLRAAAAAIGAALLLAVSGAGLAGLLPTAAASVPSIASITPVPPVPGPDAAALHLIPNAPQVLAASRGHVSGRGTTSAVPPLVGNSVTVIGDSILIDAAPYLRTALPGIVIDAMVGRQMVEAPAVIAQLRREGLLGSRVVIELGTNGPFTTAQLEDVLRALRGASEIVLVNTRVPRPWEGEVNATLAAVAKRSPKVTLVDWYAASGGHSSYFYPDGVHLNPTGARAFAHLIVQALRHGTPLATSLKTVRAKGIAITRSQRAPGAPAGRNENLHVRWQPMGTFAAFRCRAQRGSRQYNLRPKAPPRPSPWCSRTATAA